MIRINVKESKKFKDFQYCLFIKCSFDIDIVSKFRKLEFRYFHVNSDCWEIAPIHLQAVKNILINQEYQIIGEELLQNDLGDFTFKTKPYQYQIEGVKYGIDKRHWHLGDEQGLGKTKQIIDLARYLKEIQGVEHCLVICGVASLRWNWRDEIETHSDETYKLLGFRSRKRSNKLYDGGTKAKLEDLEEVPEEFFWIINIEAFREEAIVKLLKKYHENGTIGAIFIDEVHTLMGAGAAEGATDAANILKPSLARGEIQVIGATTIDEYRKNIEKDAALERRFQPVMVSEPTVEDTISILRGLKDRYEVFHGVKITDGALVSAATLSDRYISDRFLPDKAIDLVDEACAMIKTELDSMPAELDEKRRKIMQLEIEEAALKKETDNLSKERLDALQKELSELRSDFNIQKAKWDSEKSSVDQVSKLKEEIDQINTQIAQAKREYDLNKAAELQYGKLPQAQKALEEAEKKSSNRDMSLVHESVTEEEIAKIISRWTGIPVSKLSESERQKTLNLDEQLHKRVIGQDEGVTKVTEAIIRSKAGIKDPTKPIGSFLFLGPTGVGKTELAKALAESLFDDESNIVRLDMSEYMEKYSVSRLIGAPPGYVGYDEGGQLTEAVRRKPYSVVLFDEVEKAHPDVFNVLLQVLDDGRITDSQGRTVDFKNTIIIMTSNIGSSYLLEGINPDGSIKPEAEEAVMGDLKNHFRPEFLNRLDEIIMFKPLTKDNISNIINLLVADVNKRLADKELEIVLTDTAKDFIVENGFDPMYGARPLKRYVQKTVETLAAKLILAGNINTGDDIVIDLVDGKLTARAAARAVEG